MPLRPPQGRRRRCVCRQPRQHAHRPGHRPDPSLGHRAVHRPRPGPTADHRRGDPADGERLCVLRGRFEHCAGGTQPRAVRSAARRDDRRLALGGLHQRCRRQRRRDGRRARRDLDRWAARSGSRVRILVAGTGCERRPTGLDHGDRRAEPPSPAHPGDDRPDADPRRTTGLLPQDRGPGRAGAQHLRPVRDLRRVRHRDRHRGVTASPRATGSAQRATQPGGRDLHVPRPAAHRGGPGRVGGQRRVPGQGGRPRRSGRDEGQQRQPSRAGRPRGAVHPRAAHRERDRAVSGGRGGRGPRVGGTRGIGPVTHPPVDAARCRDHRVPRHPRLGRHHDRLPARHPGHRPR